MYICYSIVSRLLGWSHGMCLMYSTRIIIFSCQGLGVTILPYPSLLCTTTGTLDVVSKMYAFISLQFEEVGRRKMLLLGI